MRLDKFLKVSRILKRRTVANEACAGGKAYMLKSTAANGRTAKPGVQLKTGDVVNISFAGFDLTFAVKELRESVRKEEAADMYEIIGETEK